MRAWQKETRVIWIEGDHDESLGNLVVWSAQAHAVQVVSDVTSREGRKIKLRARHRRMFEYLISLGDQLVQQGFKATIT